MAAWNTLANVLLLLAGGFLLGALAERLRQSAILGYLLAGTLLGPHVLHWIDRPEDVTLLAELGVALLLFTIGLEFSWRRLRGLGGAAIGGGFLQIGLTIAAGAALALPFGVGGRTAVVLGCMLALSSTAYVLRLLTRRAEMDSRHGRLAVAVLLVQDVAVVPILLLVTVLEEGSAPLGALLELGRLFGLALVLVLGFLVLFNVVVPLLFGTATMLRNRELPLLLAVASGLGSALAAHEMGLSPAIGAFLAGMLLADSPFSTQVRADVSALRTVLMTLFFGSIGMYGDPAWILHHAPVVLLAVAGVLLLKTGLAALAVRRPAATSAAALATGVCLAQIGEFSFVIAEIVRSSLLGDDLFQLVVSVTIVTLFLTPYMVAAGSRLAAGRLGTRSGTTGPPRATPPGEGGHVVVVGCGPTGQAVSRALAHRGVEAHILDLNRTSVEGARRAGHTAHVGDATHPDVLEHAGVANALAVVVTVPDPQGARAVVEQVRHLAPWVRIFVRARYHVHRGALAAAGADVVVDEEEEMGRALAHVLVSALDVAAPAPRPPGAAGG